MASGPCRPRMLQEARSAGMSCLHDPPATRFNTLPRTEASMRPIPLLGGLMCLAISAALAQDPVKVDPNHYKVEFENAQVRVLRIHYGAHEKSVMHSHPASVRVFLTDVHAKFTYPAGKSGEVPGNAGEAGGAKAGVHLTARIVCTWVGRL